MLSSDLRRRMVELIASCARIPTWARALCRDCLQTGAGPRVKF